MQSSHRIDQWASSGLTLPPDRPATSLRTRAYGRLHSTRTCTRRSHQSFDTLASRNVPALAIDLRSNEGGLDVGDVLFSHLVAEPKRVSTPLRVVRCERASADLLPGTRS